MNPQRAAWREGAVEAAGVAIALALLAEAIWRHRFFIHDDAFISLRYAENLIRHGELVWNAGERVEGYTNFLHVLLSAGLMAFDVPPVTALRVLGAAAVAGLLAATLLGARSVAPAPRDTWLRALAVIVVAMTPGVAVWLLGGLEAVVVAAFLAAGTVTVLRFGTAGIEPFRAARAGVWFALAVLTRPDAAVYIAATALAVLLTGGNGWRGRLVRAGLVGGIPAAVALAHLGWRVGYYGELLPLTYYAKVGVPAELRWSFLPQFLLGGMVGATVVYLGALAALVTAFAGHASARWGLLALPVFAHFGYVLWTGGDHMPAGRVLVVLVVPASLLLLGAIAASGRSARFALAALALAAIFAMGYPLRGLKMAGAAFVGEIVGKHIAGSWPAGSLVALNTVGATAFEAPDLRFIDMLGLNDKTIAMRRDIPVRTRAQTYPGHAKGDGVYVLSRKPDFIILGHTEGRPASAPVFLSDVELAESPEFRRCYALRQETIDYTAAFARRGPPRPRPLIFTYYMRVCP